jgi:hypothetical protein
MYIEIERRTAIVREFGAAQCGRRSREGHVKAGLDVRYPFDVVECGNPDAPPIAKNLFSDARSVQFRELVAMARATGCSHAAGRPVHRDPR